MPRQVQYQGPVVIRVNKVSIEGKESLKLTICPAPRTPSFLTSAAAAVAGVELKLRSCERVVRRAAWRDAAKKDMVQ